MICSSAFKKFDSTSSDPAPLTACGPVGILRFETIAAAVCTAVGLRTTRTLVPREFGSHAGADGYLL
jgi:hypothetical protein